MDEGEGEPGLDARIGRLLQELREARGVSRQSLASRCGISAMQLRKYELGENRIAFARLMDLAGSLAIRPSDLAGAIDGREWRPEGALDLLSLVRLPHARKLLDAYERLPPDARKAVLLLAETLAGLEQACPEG